MKRMECKLSQDVRVEARFGPDTTKEPVRIVPELSFKLFLSRNEPKSLK